MHFIYVILGYTVSSLSSLYFYIIIIIYTHIIIYCNYDYNNYYYYYYYHICESITFFSCKLLF